MLLKELGGRGWSRTTLCSVDRLVRGTPRTGVACDAASGRVTAAIGCPDAPSGSCRTPGPCSGRSPPSADARRGPCALMRLRLVVSRPQRCVSARARCPGSGLRGRQFSEVRPEPSTRRVCAGNTPVEERDPEPDALPAVYWRSSGATASHVGVEQRLGKW